MQLKLQRSQRMGGVLGNTVIFALDVRAAYTSEEANNIARYKIGKEIIYSSQASKQHQARMHASLERGGSAKESMAGLAGGLYSMAMAKMNLNITITSLGQGHHIECKDLNELAEAEETVMQACRSIRDYLKMAATFNGSTFVVDFTEKDEAVHAAGGGEVFAKLPASTTTGVIEATFEETPRYPPGTVGAEYHSGKNPARTERVAIQSDTGPGSFEDASIYGVPLMRPRSSSAIEESGFAILKAEWKKIQPHVDRLILRFWGTETWQKLVMIGGAVLLVVWIAYFSFHETPAPTAENTPVTNPSRPLGEVNLSGQ